jgi:hypothetical protein
MFGDRSVTRRFDPDGGHVIFGRADVRVAIRTRERVEQNARCLKCGEELPRAHSRVDADGKRCGSIPTRDADHMTIAESRLAASTGDMSRTSDGRSSVFRVRPVMVPALNCSNDRP